MISFNLKKIKIQLYPSFFIFMAIMVALNYTEQFFILFLAVTLHELTHIIFAEFFGLEPEKIIITPIGETAVIKNLETLGFTKKILVIAAGPLINLLLYIFTAVIFREKYEFFKTANLSIALFNLLPVYPLDGGRLLQFVLANRIGIIPSNRIVMDLSSFFSKVIVATGFLQVILFPFNISLLCIGLYLNKIAKREYLHMTLEFYKIILLKNNKMHCKNQIPIRAVILGNCMEVKEMLYKICWDYYYVFHILQEGAIKKTITEQELINYVVKNGLNGNAGEIVSQSE